MPSLMKGGYPLSFHHSSASAAVRGGCSRRADRRDIHACTLSSKIPDGESLESSSCKQVYLQHTQQVYSCEIMNSVTLSRHACGVGILCFALVGLQRDAHQFILSLRQSSAI